MGCWVLEGSRSKTTFICDGDKEVTRRTMKMRNSRRGKEEYFQVGLQEDLLEESIIWWPRVRIDLSWTFRLIALRFLFVLVFHLVALSCYIASFFPPKLGCAKFDRVVTHKMMLRHVWIFWRQSVPGRTLQKRYRSKISRYRLITTYPH